MNAFAKYYVNIIKKFFNDIYNFFKNFFNSLIDILIRNPLNYVKELFKVTNTFNFLDWILLIFVFIINIAFIVFLLIRLYQLVKRYLKFRRKEVEKDDLIEEVSNLNQKVIELIDEKNKILAMKISSLGVKPGELPPGEVEDEEDNKKEESRFTKLIDVDEAYKDYQPNYTILQEDMVSLKELTERFVNFAASQLKLYYSHDDVRAFLAGMASSKLLILEGISGTGKTSLPYAFGKFFQRETSIISVQPSWRDRTELMGYLNEFTKKFNETEFLRSIYEATYRKDINLIVLDEMNLSRIEYYFADFLSVLELPNPEQWQLDLVPGTRKSDPKNLNHGIITIPQNIWFVGTANNDDSTFLITDKVYDRAMSIEISKRAGYIDAPPTKPLTIDYDYLQELFDKSTTEFTITPNTLDGFNKIAKFIEEKFGILFGNRIMKQINKFVPAYIGCGGDELIAFDYILSRKILRKFEAINLAFLKEELDQLIQLFERTFGKKTFERSIEYLNKLKKIY